MHKIALQRRGFTLGDISALPASHSGSACRNKVVWKSGKPIVLKGFCKILLDEHSENIDQAQKLYTSYLNGAEGIDLIEGEPYRLRLEPNFESLGGSFNEGDHQEIETLFFDVSENNKLVAEDLWMKVSWLSFINDDASMRFRFSFGVDFEEDVAADHRRQHYAAELANSIFPESSIITKNDKLNEYLRTILGDAPLNFVERIVYFNAPNGGAYFHHDRERGHAGVIYAQLSGSTYWLALPKQSLVEEINSFIDECANNARWPASFTTLMQTELLTLVDEPNSIAAQLDTFANSTLIHLINETDAFVQRLIQRGHGQLIQTGDFILLPQDSDKLCCWHSVFNVGDEPGEALSFAIRRA